jgi:hypothetical protein
MSIIINKPANQNLNEVLKNGSTGTDPIYLQVDQLSTGVSVEYTGSPARSSVYAAQGALIIDGLTGVNTQYLSTEAHMQTVSGSTFLNDTRYALNYLQYSQEDTTNGDSLIQSIYPSSNLDGGDYSIYLPNFNGTLAVTTNVASGFSIDTSTGNQTLLIKSGNLTIPTVAIGVNFVNLDLAAFDDGLTVYIVKKTSGNLKFQATGGGTLYGNSTVSSNGLIIITRLGGNFYINQP